jgi:hypothetical protein
VGKCGGGNLVHKLGTEKCAILKVVDNKVRYFESYYYSKEVVEDKRYKLGFIHTHNVNKETIPQILNECEEYILLCRDPVTRFISIFNHWYEIYELKKSHIKKMKSEKEQVLSHDPSYDKYFDIFKSANDLAESLNSKNDLYEFALEAVMHIAHFRQGMKHYLVNEDTIQNNITKFKYILRIEHYKEDFAKIHKEILMKYDITSLSYKDFFRNIRHKTLKTKSNQHLSHIAIKNIKDFYKEDYDMFEVLVKYNIIGKKYTDRFI